MVRNVPSMASLRNSISNADANNVPSANIQPTTRPTHGIDSAPASPDAPAQILGDHACPNQLMDKVSTETATPQEEASWKEQKAARIQLHHQANSGSATSQEISQLDGTRRDVAEQAEAQMVREMPMVNGRIEQAANHHLAAPPEAFMLDQYCPPINACTDGESNSDADKSLAAGPITCRALEDYYVQLRLLEQQNQRRMFMVRGESPARDTGETFKQIRARRFPKATRVNAEKYCKPFCEALTNNPTVFHFVAATEDQLKDTGFSELNERDSWDDLQPGKSYFVERNGSSLIAFTVGAKYKPGNGAAILAGHVDALTAKLKPISQVPNKAGYLQLGVAPYAGAPNTTWWDRDLSVGGRVLVREGKKIVTKLVKLDWPIARIPTLAPHFGAAAQGPFNPETQMVPIIGLDSTKSTSSHSDAEAFSRPPIIGSSQYGAVSSFVSTQPPRLVKAIGDALGLSVDSYSKIVNWELELFDTQPATVGGLDKEFIFAGRIDDKLCSWAAVQALIEAKKSGDTDDSSIIKIVGLFDDEEIGSLLRQGARGNFLPSTIERIVGSLNGGHASADLIGRTNANSFIVSSDVIHAVNPNFLNAYLENHSPHLNVGVVVSADSNGHMTTDSVSTAILQRCADKVGAKLQVFQIRNDSRSGGTVGPMLSAATGIRAIDAGIPQLSMHSIRATTGSLDPGLGVLCFLGFLNGFESVDKEFR